LLAGVDSGVAGLLARLLLPGLPGWLWYPLAVLLVVAVAWGAVCVVRRVPALVATLALYAGAIALWPYIPDRFAWVLMPWLMLLGVIGGADAWRRARPWRALATVLLIAVALGYPRREAISIGTRGFAATAEGISQPFRLLVPAIAQETPAD
ncbi:hypothetical protein, partial [Hydrogenophaga sp.]|uniref:hypothetical protein n=1 Tax=Hydrogenophaga sp. TaxID=1904254 RepID=UPI0016A1641A